MRAASGVKRAEDGTGEAVESCKGLAPASIAGRPLRTSSVPLSTDPDSNFSLESSLSLRIMLFAFLKAHTVFGGEPVLR